MSEMPSKTAYCIGADLCSAAQGVIDAADRPFTRAVTLPTLEDRRFAHLFGENAQAVAVHAAGVHAVVYHNGEPGLYAIDATLDATDALPKRQAYLEVGFVPTGTYLFDNGPDSTIGEIVPGTRSAFVPMINPLFGPLIKGLREGVLPSPEFVAEQLSIGNSTF